MPKVSQLALLALAGSLLCGCENQSRSMPQPSFKFSVEDVFYIRNIDRVILVGTISEGAVNVGESATLHTKNGPVSVQVEGIEVFQKGAVSQAAAGQQVGLALKDIKQDQVSFGDLVVGNTKH